MGDHYLPVDGDPYREWWHQQFAIPPDTLEGCSFWQRGRSSIWVAAADVDPGRLTPVDGVGIPCLRIGRDVWKPTAIAAIEFGVEACRNVVELDTEETRRFLDREVIVFAADDPRRTLPNRGFVIARYHGLPMGCGLWSGGTLESEVPKGRRLPEIDLPLRR